MPSPLLENLQSAIRGEGLDGWLFYNYRHRDVLADEILGLDKRGPATRPWLYAVPLAGQALKLVHVIEANCLDSLPGQKQSYASAADFDNSLRSLAGKRWGAHFSAQLPVISLLDEGAAGRFRAAGLVLVSAAGLVQRLKGLLGAAGIASHLRSNTQLHILVAEAWQAICQAFHNRRPLYEADIRRHLMEGLASRHLITDQPPIVAAGRNSANPHYDFDGQGSLIKVGDPIQIDIWAKETQPTAVYADIAWVGVYAETASMLQATVFTKLAAARDAAVNFMAAELAAGRRPSGAAVDKTVRYQLSEAGFEAALRHRTGHAIDSECHGSGVNLDSVEFPDDRQLLDGSCFSVEPGVYFSDYGFRTEINARIETGRILVSGPPPQTRLLDCGKA